MGNKQAQRRTSARRAATFLAALGALVMSSGAALMVMAAPANAAEKVTFCHSTGSGSNEWIELTTSVNAFYVGHVLKQHTSDIYPAVSFVKKGQTIDVPAQGDQSVLENNCGAEEPPPPGDTEIAVDIEFTDPSCDNNNTASYAVTGDDTDVTVGESAAPAPGATITVTATAKDGFVFDGGQSTYSEEYPFPAAKTCPTSTQVESQVVVSPPKVKTPKAKTPTKAHAATVTPTLVEAGLAGTTQDLRGEQGLALMVAGMVMLAAAGGLGLRVRGAAARR
jgi:hypothetical protein